MFKKYFKLRHEKIYFYSFLIAYVSLFLPWLRLLAFFVPGIILPFGGLTAILLTFNAIHFFWAKRKQKVLAISNIVIGSLCILCGIGHFLGYQPSVSFVGGLYTYFIGVYLSILGSIGILISGILGVKHKKKMEWWLLLKFFKPLFNKRAHLHTTLKSWCFVRKQKSKCALIHHFFKLMYRARSLALFYCEILRCKIKNSFHSCKNKNKFWKASNGYAAAYPVRQATGL